MSTNDAVGTVSYGDAYRSIAGGSSLLPINATPGYNAANPAPPANNAITLRPSAEPLSALNQVPEAGLIISSKG